ncbi:MAG: MerR family transcriptional regulator [Chitinophagaceae bacterium]|nr:MerR family transcriptional regulator [Chitinophagaceae bacterium]
MNVFTIKDLENLSGIKAHTIRIWEQRYSFLKPKRTDTNIRYYSTDELKAVLNIALLNKYGYKISHIDKMSAEEMRQKIIDLSHAEAQQERLINELVQYMVDLDIQRFEDVLNQYIRARGIERTITQLMFPFLDKIGILWMTNFIQPAQEHLVANVIRQKLIVGIENVHSSMRTDKIVVLFLPEGEYHELGLLYIYYLLKSKGVQVLYLGSDVPVRDMEFLVNAKRPDFLLTHLTSVPANFSIDKFLSHVHQTIPDTKLVVSGQLSVCYPRKSYPNVEFKRSLQEVMEFITGL